MALSLQSHYSSMRFGTAPLMQLRLENLHLRFLIKEHGDSKDFRTIEAPCSAIRMNSDPYIVVCTQSQRLWPRACHLPRHPTV